MRERATYQVSPDRRVEAMRARFRSHVYPLHSHETYSFGVTEAGAQGFRCRGEHRVSATGMVMVLNPDDPHDGHAADELGYHYRMLHVDVGLVADVVADVTDGRSGLPLFAEPVMADDVLAGAIRRLDEAVARADRLSYDESVLRLVVAMVNRSATRPLRIRQPRADVRRARDLLVERLAEPSSVEELAAAAGCSRFALYRGFRATYGLSPSDYQRQERLRRARRMIAGGRPLAEVAAAVGFADQGHLGRWFVRTYGITPGAYRRALGVVPVRIGMRGRPAR